MSNAEPDKNGGKKSKGGLSVLGLLLMTLMAVGSGIGFGTMLPGLMEPAKKPHPEPSKTAQEHAPGRQLLPLTPITTNLAQPTATWVRLESMLVAEQDLGVDGPVLVKRLSEDIIGYLRTISLDQISGPSGFQHLREDINDRVRIRSAGKVSGIVITSLILE